MLAKHAEALTGGAMTAEQIAVLSDIHGNRWALEAVLDDMARRGITAAVNLGDLFYGPLDPAGTAHLLSGFDWPTVQGNEDRLLNEAAAGSSDQRFDHALRELDASSLRWIESLPQTLFVGGTFLLVHGTPASDHEYLLESVSEDRGVRVRSDNEVAERLAGVPAPVILCAHSHLPSTRKLRDGRLIVNPGSVGLPAYWDDVPCSHVMEAGSPHARYAILSNRASGWIADHVALAYDWTAAAHAAREHGRADWAEWLATGRITSP